MPMLTVVETAKFQKIADAIWSESERLEFIGWIAAHPLAGDVMPGAQGARKVRWQAQGKGKRGGVRVIYFHLPLDGAVLLILLYAKSQQENIQLREITRSTHGN